LGFSDHEYYLDSFNFDNLYSIKNKTDLSVKVGIEFDYKPGREGAIKDILDRYPLEYCIGSVHHINGWNFDNPKYREKFAEYKGEEELKELYSEYFMLVKRAVDSCLFDIIGHLDLIKIFGHILEDRSFVLDLVDPVFKSLKSTDTALEINTNGLNKPVEEIYPAVDIIKLAIYKDVDMVLGSDAHIPERVGENFDEIDHLLEIME